MEEIQKIMDTAAAFQQKCWFCETNWASPNCARIVTLHKYEGVDRKHYRHMTRDINIPQCDECASVGGTKGQTGVAALFVIIIVAFAGAILSGIYVSKITDGMVWAAILAGFVVYIVLVFVFSFLAKRLLTFQGTKEQEEHFKLVMKKDVYQYPEIRELLSQGWSRTV